MKRPAPTQRTPYPIVRALALLALTFFSIHAHACQCVALDMKKISATSYSIFEAKITAQVITQVGDEEVVASEFTIISVHKGNPM
ncbi:MAG: hypothetical protein AAAB16_20280, partial [Pseudomonas sp.]|uniref:hypothetical protein n=1 Tax=Pseudomonas sp. TaxID=306 RepID=UPI0030F1C4E1